MKPRMTSSNSPGKTAPRGNDPAADSNVLLLVEDDIVVRHPLAEYLRECGFTVFEAASGEEARKALSTPELGIEIVLADMSGCGNGFELRQWIREQGLSVEIILAATVDKAVDHAGKVCNEGPALVKPYQHHLVLKNIRRMLAKRNENRS